MKLLHVITKMDPSMGGVCQAVRTIVSGLAEQGISSEVISLDAPSASFLSNEPLLIHPLGPANNPWCFNPKLTSWFKDNLSRFDVVIVHGLWQYHTYAVNKVMKHYRQEKKKVPKLFIMPHGMLDPYFQQASGRKLKAIRNWMYWKLIEGHVINEADGLLFTCETECLLARLPFKPYYPKKENVVGLGGERPSSYNSLMREAFLKKCPILKNEPYLLFLSRIHEKKGVDILLNSYSILMARIRDAVYGDGSIDTLRTNIPKLVIAGPGIDSIYGKKIKQLVSEDISLKNNVFFTGMLSGNAKWGAFYGCEAFILPSHQENFGIAVVEALACGKPALISNKVNIWRELVNSHGGLVEDDTQKGTFKLLEKWLQLSAEEKSNYGKNAQKSFNENFAMESATNQFLKAITA